VCKNQKRATGLCTQGLSRGAARNGGSFFAVKVISLSCIKISFGLDFFGNDKAPDFAYVLD